VLGGHRGGAIFFLLFFLIGALPGPAKEEEVNAAGGRNWYGVEQEKKRDRETGTSACAWQVNWGSQGGDLCNVSEECCWKGETDAWVCKQSSKGSDPF
jgi:hypothetical protein